MPTTRVLRSCWPQRFRAGGSGGGGTPEHVHAALTKSTDKKITCCGEYFLDSILRLRISITAGVKSRYSSKNKNIRRFLRRFRLQMSPFCSPACGDAFMRSQHTRSLSAARLASLLDTPINCGHGHGHRLYVTDCGRSPLIVTPRLFTSDNRGAVSSSASINRACEEISVSFFIRLAYLCHQVTYIGTGERKK